MWGAKRSNVLREMFPLSVFRSKRRGLPELVRSQLRTVKVADWQIEQAVCNLVMSKVIGSTGRHYNGISSKGLVDKIASAAGAYSEIADGKDNLEEFGPLTDAAIDDIAADVKAANDGEYALFGNFGGTALGDIALVPAVNLKDPRGIRDVAEWYVSTRSRRDYIHKIYERQVEIALGNLERIHARIGDSIDILFLCGTDFGTQSSSFCSVSTFNELWFPHYKLMCDWIHGHTSWKIFKHTCGSAARFFDSFVEAGIDIVNPVQCSAVGMEPEQLKAKYGDRLVFWGGGVDTQQVLPFGTPEQVREQVLRRCEIFAPGGGFVFNTIHNIQAGTPVANILAMVNALRSLD